MSIRRLISPRAFAIACVASAACLVLNALVAIARTGVYGPDMNPWPPQTGDLLAALGSAGRRTLVFVHLTLDVAFPLAYSVLLLNLLNWSGRRAGVRPSSPLLLIPLAAGAADLLENAGLVFLAAQHPRMPVALVWTTGFFTWTKFVGVFLSAGLVLAWLLFGGARPTRRRRAAVAAVAALATAVPAGALFFAGDPSPSPATLPMPACTTLLIVGLRGNGDSLGVDGGVGGDTSAVVERITGRVGGSIDVASVGFPYVTGPPVQIVAHVRTATRLLVEYAAARSVRCPGERLVLVGQSEGAAVVHLALPRLGGHVDAVVLLADPARLTGTPYDDLGSANDGLLARPLLNGVRNLAGPVHDVVPASLDAVVRSYCLPTDPVCDASWATELQGIRSGVHTTYRLNPGGIADRAAAFVTRRLGKDG